MALGLANKLVTSIKDAVCFSAIEPKVTTEVGKLLESPLVVCTDVLVDGTRLELIEELLVELDRRRFSPCLVFAALCGSCV